MIKKVKVILLNNKIILENFSFLSALQVSNLLIFLIIIPFLVRVLGKELYGLVVFAQTISIYFAILVNFGFTVTATRDISVHRDYMDKTSSIISTVLILKGSFFILSLVVLSFLVLTIPLFNQHPAIFFLSMLYCLSETLFPIWYFQGIEKMKYIAIINIIARIGSSILIFIFIRQPGDYVLVPLLLGIGTISGAIAGLYIVFVQHRHRFVVLAVSDLVSSIKDNVPIFFSNVSSQMYVYANKLIVGSFLGMQDVAIYDIVEKIVNLLKVPVQIVGQTLFPRVSRDKDLRFVKTAMVFVFVFFVVVYSSVFFLAGHLIQLFSGSSNPSAVLLLRILALSLLPICLGLFYAELLLVPFGMLKDYARMRGLSLVVYMLAVGALIALNQIGLIQLALAVIIVEVFVFLYSYYLCKKTKII